MAFVDVDAVGWGWGWQLVLEDGFDAGIGVRFGEQSTVSDVVELSAHDGGASVLVAFASDVVDQAHSGALFACGVHEHLLGDLAIGPVWIGQGEYAGDWPNVVEHVAPVYELVEGFHFKGRRRHERVGWGPVRGDACDSDGAWEQAFGAVGDEQCVFVSRSVCEGAVYADWATLLG